ncbi:MAG: hypothetical protein ABSH34_23725, partial [Verrucomicrobiota bacterium]
SSIANDHFSIFNYQLTAETRVAWGTAHATVSYTGMIRGKSSPGLRLVPSTLDPRPSTLDPPAVYSPPNLR